MKTYKELIDQIMIQESTFKYEPYMYKPLELEVVKNKEKSNALRQEEHHDIFHNGEHIGILTSKMGQRRDVKNDRRKTIDFKDEKDKKIWNYTIFGGHHRMQHAVRKNPDGPVSDFHSDNQSSKKLALEQFANYHIQYQ